MITIRLATVADAAVLAKIGAATFVETFGHLYTRDDLETFLHGSRSEQAYAKQLAGGAHAWLALDESGTAIGYAVAGPCKLPVENLEPSAAELRELYVLASHQKHKLGSQLFSAVLSSTQLSGYAPWYIGVWSENYGAQRFYARHGFEKVGEYDFPVGDHVDREFILKR